MLILIAAVAALCSIAGFGTFILLELDSEVFYWSLTLEAGSDTQLLTDAAPQHAATRHAAARRTSTQRTGGVNGVLDSA